MTQVIIPVILCGGAGRRLWPLSRTARPKQFVRLLSRYSLVQETVMRTRRVLPGCKHLIYVTAAGMQSLLESQLQALDENGAHHVLAEPCRRNTAAAVALAAHYAAAAFGPDTVLWVLPSDHFIGNEQALQRAVETALNTAQNGCLVTFGITPTRPDTGYGYIHRGEKLEEGVFNITGFTEKPDAQAAQRYIEKGGYLWNSGMFVFQTGAALAAFDTYAPALVNLVVRATEGDPRNPRLDFYRRIQAAPFDKAIMEKTDSGAVVPCDIGWSDIGSWKSFLSVWFGR